MKEKLRDILYGRDLNSYSYVAVDNDGWVYCYEKKPTTFDGYWDAREQTYSAPYITRIDPTNDWYNHCYAISEVLSHIELDKTQVYDLNSLSIDQLKEFCNAAEIDAVRVAFSSDRVVTYCNGWILTRNQPTFDSLRLFINDLKGSDIYWDGNLVLNYDPNKTNIGVVDGEFSNDVLVTDESVVEVAHPSVVRSILRGLVPNSVVFMSDGKWHIASDEGVHFNGDKWLI